MTLMAVVFFIWARAQGRLSITENAVGSLMAPVQNAVSGATAWTRDLFKDFIDRDKLRSDYEDSLVQIDILSMRIAELEEASRENERLKGLLEISERYEQQNPVYAQVIGRPPGVWADTFSINRGSLDGISVDMAVITAQGLVGCVYDVGLYYSKVRTIIDPQSSVAGLVENTRDNGIIQGQMSANSADPECHMFYLPPDNDIVPGDRVLTSGMDGKYPKGIPIGNIRSISREPDASRQFAIISPLADLSRVEEVIVLRVIVENDSGSALPRLPDPTSRMYPTESPAPHLDDSIEPLPTPIMDDDIWNYPTPDSGEVTPAIGTASPAPGEQTATVPEDIWADGN
jgi:rod shape-determining protein MreC